MTDAVCEDRGAKTSRQGETAIIRTRAACGGGGQGVPGRGDYNGNAGDKDGETGMPGNEHA
jgi:hypothetical protein